MEKRRHMGSNQPCDTFIQTRTNASIRVLVLPIELFLFSNNILSPGVFQGESTILVGCGSSEGGQEIDVSAGDVIVLPAGIGHCSTQSSNNYKYIGVYPDVRGPLFKPPFLRILISLRGLRNGATNLASWRLIFRS